MKKTALITLSMVFLAGCSTTQSGSRACHAQDQHRQSAHMMMTAPPLKWGGQTITQYHQYFFAKSPKTTTITDAQKEGIRSVIDLRPKNKTDKNLKQLADNHEWLYQSLHLPENGDFDLDLFSKFQSTVDKASHHKTLVVHDNPNHAAAWFAAHLATMHRLNTKTALTIGQNLGLKDKKMSENLTRFLASEEGPQVVDPVPPKK